MLLADASVLGYVAGDSTHPMAAHARAFVRAVADGAERATTTSEVIQEFMRVAGATRDREIVSGIARRFVDLLSPLRVVDEDNIVQAALEYERHPSIGSLDAVLVALVRRHDGFELLTADPELLALDDVPTRPLASFA